MSRKYSIYVNLDNGMGNKLFDILTLLYIKKTYNCNIFIVEKDTIHTKTFDKKISDVFINLKSDIFFINEDEMKKIEAIPYVNIIKTDTFRKFKKRLKSINIMVDIYKLWIFSKIYFNNLNYNFYFKIKDDIIPNEVHNLSKTKYVCIHIRYGDKLCYLKYKSKHTRIPRYTKTAFLLYTPEYYIKTINYLSKKFMIIIVTDSYDIVISKIYNKLAYTNNIFISKFPYYIDLFIMINASYLFLSHSTFSFIAAFLNDKVQNNHIILVSLDNKNKNTGWGDYLVDKNWNIIKNKKYLLNFNENSANKFLDANTLAKYCRDNKW
jgi:hypothetical protein